MTYHKVNGLSYLLMFVAAIPLYFLFDAYGRTVQGFVISLTICGIVSIISILRDIVTKTAFVTTMIGIVAVHILLIAFIPWGQNLQFGIIATPIVVIDMYLCSRLLVAASESR